MDFKPRAESVSSPLPNFAQLALGSGQRLQSDEVITYCHAVGIHLHQERTQSGQEEEHTKTHREVRNQAFIHTIHTEPTLKITHTHVERQNRTKVRAETTNTT